MKASLIVFSLMLYHSLSFGSDHYLSDEQIRHLLVAESIRIFPGKCPCPYSLEKKKSCFGKKCKVRLCGRKSAWSRTPTGYLGPLCFSTDV